jgi:hypothetical protein
MSMDFTSESGSRLYPSGSAWSFFLRLAEEYGWNPAGSVPPEGVQASEWDGGYDSNDGQRVTREDAAAMAAALERVLTDPAGDARQRTVNQKLNEDVRAVAKEKFGIDFPPDDDDDVIPRPEDLAAIVSFLSAGGFRID